MPTLTQIEQILRQTDNIVSQSEDAAIQAMERAIRGRLRELEARIQRLHLQALDPTRLSDTTRREAVARGLVVQLESALQALHVSQNRSVSEPMRKAIVTANEQGAKRADDLMALYLGRKGIVDTGEGPAQLAADLEAVNAAMTNLEARLYRHETATIDASREAIVGGLVRGEGPRKIGAAIREETGLSLFNAERIARTETINALNTRADATYKANGLELCQILETLDKRVCPYCVERHLNIYEISKSPGSAHPLCRFSSTPIRAEWLTNGLIDLKEMEASKAAILEQTGGKTKGGQTPFDKLRGVPAAVPVWKVGDPLSKLGASAELPAATKAPAVVQALPEPGKFKDLAEAQAWADKTHPNIKWDFDGAHIDTINPTLAQFDKLASEFPEVAARLEYLGTRPTDPFGGVAHATRNGKQIGINPKYYGDPEMFKQAWAECESVGFHPKGNTEIDSVLTHEFGHQLENWLKSDPDLSFLPVRSSTFGSVGDLVIEWNARHAATSELSDYALTSKAEAWAEAFASHYHTPASLQADYVKEQRDLIDFLMSTRSQWTGNPQELRDVGNIDERQRVINQIAELRKRFGI